MTETEFATPGLAKMARDCELFAQKWHEWFSTQPHSMPCVQGHGERQVLVEFSIIESWKLREFVVRFKRCEECVERARLGQVAMKNTKRRKQKGKT